MIEYSEFKQIINLLRSPDAEVCELGRQLIAEFDNVKRVFGYGTHTELWISTKTNSYIITPMPTTEWFIKDLYKNLTEC